jgi:hypothetical protein
VGNKRKGDNVYKAALVSRTHPIYPQMHWLLLLLSFFLLLVGTVIIISRYSFHEKLCYFPEKATSYAITPFRFGCMFIVFLRLALSHFPASFEDIFIKASDGIEIV